MDTSEIGSWEEFTQLAGLVTHQVTPPWTRYAFRGQADASWPLKPSLHRYFEDGITDDRVLELERAAYKSFQQHIPERSLLKLMVEMQHFGAPTRLLGWSRSIYVAAYFAVVSEPEKDGALWLVDCTVKPLRFDANAEDHMTSPTAKKRLMFGWLESDQRDRMIAQQALFSCPVHILSDHETLLEEAAGAGSTADGSFTKATIPGALKLNFLKQLRAMNTTANSLFPGMDGLGRSVREALRLC